MTLLVVVRYPDPALAMACANVTTFDHALAALSDDLLETMRAAPGIGITAAHAGIHLRIAVIELPGEQPRTFVNPRVLASSDDLARHPEGSVSMPGIVEEVERPATVTVSWQDVEGGRHEGSFGGLMAVCLQHEIDQLDGIFWLRRLSRLKRERAIRRREKALRRDA